MCQGCLTVLLSEKSLTMPVTLQEMTMEFILEQGIEYCHLVPWTVGESLTAFFFEKMFVKLANRCRVLGTRLFLIIESNTLEEVHEDRVELMMIMKTFSIVSTDNLTMIADERLVVATLELVSVVDCLVDVVLADMFAKFTSFLEAVTALFVDESSVYPGLDRYMLR